MTFARVCALAFVMGAAALSSAYAGERAGAYAVLALGASQACARACEDDTLCVAWTFQDEACAQFATAPDDFALGPDAGLSPHAPRFIRARFAPPAASENVVPPTKLNPVVAELHDDATLALLGGPEDDGIRSRLH